MSDMGIRASGKVKHERWGDMRERDAEVLCVASNSRRTLDGYSPLFLWTELFSPLTAQDPGLP